MEITVRLFAMLREAVQQEQLIIELPEKTTVDEALKKLVGESEELGNILSKVRVVTAVNRVYEEKSYTLSDGDELALIPPVSGGAQRIKVELTTEPLQYGWLTEYVRVSSAGAIVVFEGITREVQALEYEAYVEMAEQMIEKIAGQALERHGLERAAVAHRIGKVLLSEPSVIVAVSAAHREAAFTGAREIIDRIKELAPIWKKEIEDGAEYWVEGKIPDQ